MDDTYLDDLVAREYGPMALNIICNIMLETNYPKKQSPKKVIVEETATTSTVSSASPKDYYNDFKLSDLPDEDRSIYRAQAVSLLMVDFRKVS